MVLRPHKFIFRNSQDIPLSLATKALRHKVLIFNFDFSLGLRVFVANKYFDTTSYFLKIHLSVNNISSPILSMIN